MVGCLRFQPSTSYHLRTQQLRERLSRGEALRSAVAMTSGEFAALPGGTIELSNLGGQRNDKKSRVFFFSFEKTGGFEVVCFFLFFFF